MTAAALRTERARPADADVAFAPRRDSAPVRPAPRPEPAPPQPPAASGLAALIGGPPSVGGVDPGLDAALRRAGERLDLMARDGVSPDVAASFARVSPSRIASALAELPRPCVVARAVDGDGGALLLLAGPDLIELAVASGFGAAPGTTPSGRPATLIERALVERVFRLAIEALACGRDELASAGWSFTGEEQRIVAIDAEPRRVVLPGPTEVGLKAAFRLALSGREATLILLSPERPGAARGGSSRPADPAKAPPADPAIEVARATLTVSAVVGRVELRLAALCALKPGDTLMLGGREDAPLLLTLDGMAVAHGTIGRKDGLVAVAIVARSEPGSRTLERPARGVVIGGGAEEESGG